MKIAEAVRYQLETVSRGDSPDNWLGFDDADVKWFLHEHAGKDGPGLSWLRSEYQGMLDAWTKSEPDSPLVLYFFPVTPEQAAQLLQEISQ